MLNGLIIVKNNFLPQYIPNRILSTKVTVSDEFRKTYNNFLLDFFGTDVFFYVDKNRIYIHPTVAQNLKSYITENYKHVYIP